MKILIVSVYYDRGGAGKMARLLQRSFEERGHEVLFLYAYSKYGIQSLDEKNVLGVPYSFIGVPHFNFLIHRLIGVDLVSASAKPFREMLLWADIVNLHVVHSHGFNYRQLFKLLESLNKAVVVTNHDSWFYTGRCAIRGICENWRTGCKKCDFKNNYPTTIFDFASVEFEKKTSLINSIPQIKFVSPSRWIQEDLKVVYPDIPAHVIKNGIEIGVFYEKVTSLLNKADRNRARKPRFLFVTTTFKEKVKVDFSILTELVESGFQIGFVGADCPYIAENVISYGYIGARGDLLDIMIEYDILLFFSKIDNFPTTVIEGLCLGLHIMCFKSKGVAEVLEGLESFSYIESYRNILDLVNTDDFTHQITNCENRFSNALIAQNLFSHNVMVEEYLKLFNDFYSNLK